MVKNNYVKWCLVIVIILILGSYLAPVDVDAGACGGGFRTYIVELYGKTFKELFIKEKDLSLSEQEQVFYDPKEIAESLNWKGRTINTKGKLIYGKSSYIVEYEGKRYWFEKYNWKIKSIKAL